MLYHIIAKSVRKDLAGQRGNGHSCTFSLENVAEVLEIGIAAPDGAVLELKGGNVGSADDLVVGVHVT